MPADPATRRRDSLNRALEPEARERRFYVAWTLKEAWIKQRGDGVSVDRMASLETCRAEPAGPADAWSWGHGTAVISMAARAAPGHCFGDAARLETPQSWQLRDRLTSA